MSEETALDNVLTGAAGDTSSTPLPRTEGGETRVDKVVVVSAPAEVQRVRVLARPGMTEARFDAILARQMPDAEKRARADFVIPTGGSIEETRAAIGTLVSCLRGW